MLGRNKGVEPSKDPADEELHTTGTLNMGQINMYRKKKRTFDMLSKGCLATLACTQSENAYRHNNRHLVTWSTTPLVA